MLTFLVAVAIAVVFTVLVTALSGIYLPKKYYQTWSFRYHRQFSDMRLQVIAHGLLAANSHNMQAWKIVLDQGDENIFWLYINTDRLTPNVDPLSRQITISQGTFLEYVRIAAGNLACTADIELFPWGEFDGAGSTVSIAAKPVACVKLSKAGSADEPLYNMMFLSDTARIAYRSTGLPQALADRIKNVGEGRVKIFQDGEALLKLKSIVWEAALTESAVERVGMETQELFRPNEYAKNKHSFGFSLEGQGFTGISIPLVESALTLFPFINNRKLSTESFLKGTRVAIDNTPAFIMIVTEDSCRTTQVLAGMLYSRIQLMCQAEGYYLQPMSQALEEYPEMQAAYGKIHAEYARPGETIQMLARAGEPVREVSRCMRLGVNDVLDK